MQLFYKYALYVSLVVVILRLSWQFLAALVRYVCGGNACRQQVGAAQDVAFSSCPEALQIYAPVLDVDGFILNAAAGVDKVPHRHLPLYGVAHQARHKVMHLLGATKKRDKMKRPKPVAPVFDLERLLRTCLKEDRSRVARDNLDLVAYWPPSDKSCRPKCRRFQNDRDLGKNWEDIRACLLADSSPSCLRTRSDTVPPRHRRVDRQEDPRGRSSGRVATSGGGNVAVAKKKKSSKKRRKDSPVEPKEPAPRLTWCGFAKTFKACGACVCRDAQRNRLGRLFNDMTSDDDPDHVLVGALVARALEAYRYRHLGVHGKRKPAPLYDVAKGRPGSDGAAGLPPERHGRRRRAPRVSGRGPPLGPPDALEEAPQGHDERRGHGRPPDTVHSCH